MKDTRTPFVLHLYGMVTSIILVVGLPVWLLGLLVQPLRWGQRLGFLGKIPPKPPGQRRVWIHASSVGEVRACSQLVRAMSQDKGVQIVFSTMTAAGQSVARNSLREPVYFFYLPLDVPCITRQAHKNIEADVLVLIETELWPSLILEAKRWGMKVVIVNGKLSEGGAKRYARCRFLFQPVMHLVDAFMVQSESQAGRYEKLGAPRARLSVTGNLKQDAGAVKGAPLCLRESVGWSLSDIILVAGSTRPGEESVVYRGFACAKAAFPQLRLILAPRHVKRAPQVNRMIAPGNLRTRFWSQLKKTKERPVGGRAANMPGNEAHVLILDTIGDLVEAYQESDIAFIGGTLSDHGGHNILEAAAAGIPILAGPSRDNIEADANALIERGALFEVRTEADVCEVLMLLAGSANERTRRGESARSFYSSRPLASHITLGRLSEVGIL